MWGYFFFKFMHRGGGNEETFKMHLPGGGGGGYILFIFLNVLSCGLNKYSAPPQHFKMA